MAHTSGFTMKMNGSKMKMGMSGCSVKGNIKLKTSRPFLRAGVNKQFNAFASSIYTDDDNIYVKIRNRGKAMDALPSDSSKQLCLCIKMRPTSRNGIDRIVKCSGSHSGNSLIQRTEPGVRRNWQKWTTIYKMPLQRQDSRIYAGNIITIPKSDVLEKTAIWDSHNNIFIRDNINDNFFKKMPLIKWLIRRVSRYVSLQGGYHDFIFTINVYITACLCVFYTCGSGGKTMTGRTVFSQRNRKYKETLKCFFSYQR